MTTVQHKFEHEFNGRIYSPVVPPALQQKLSQEAFSGYVNNLNHVLQSDWKTKWLALGMTLFAVFLYLVTTIFLTNPATYLAAWIVVLILLELAQVPFLWYQRRKTQRLLRALNQESNAALFYPLGFGVRTEKQCLRFVTTIEVLPSQNP